MDILTPIWCALVKFWNAIQEHILQNAIDLIAWIISLLPSLEIGNEQLQWGEFGNAIGYFIPVATMVQHFTFMLGIMAIWYSYEYIMRWVKMIK